METLASLIEGRLRSALAAVAGLGETGAAGANQTLPGLATPATVTAATDPRFGDYQTNVAMVLAKQQRANPRQIAAKIIEQLDVSEICEPPEIAGAGFINFRVAYGFLNKRFAEVLRDEMLGVQKAPAAKKIVL